MIGDLSGLPTSTGGGTMAAYMVSLAIFDRQMAEGLDEGSNETEKQQQILFFYPPSTPSGERIQHVSLCSGLIDFSRYMC